MTRRTIRVRIELVGAPGEADETLAAAEIESDVIPGDRIPTDRDLAPVAGGYPWRLDLPGRRAWKRATLPTFPRERNTNALDLVYRVLRQAVHYRNR